MLLMIKYVTEPLQWTEYEYGHICTHTADIHFAIYKMVLEAHEKTRVLIVAYVKRYHTYKLMKRVRAVSYRVGTMMATNEARGYNL